MEATPAARDRLARMAERSGTTAFRIENVVGTCSHTVPVIKPCEGPYPGDAEQMIGTTRLFVAKDLLPYLSEATLDYQRGLLRQGLMLHWEHREGCACAGLFEPSEDRHVG